MKLGKCCLLKGKGRVILIAVVISVAVAAIVAAKVALLAQILERD